LRIAFFLVQRNDLDEAARVVSRVLATDPFNYGGRLFEGALRLAKGTESTKPFRVSGSPQEESADVLSTV
jgi:hypothetical protein